MQTKLGSFVETCVNVIIGFSINYAANLVILPAYGFTQLDAGTNFEIGVIYTSISIARSYCVRRWFNNKIHLFSETVANTVDIARRV